MVQEELTSKVENDWVRESSPMSLLLRYRCCVSDLSNDRYVFRRHLRIELFSLSNVDAGLLALCPSMLPKESDYSAGEIVGHSLETTNP
jgi:hypothetical protein